MGRELGKRDVNLLVTTDDGNTETVVSPTVAHGYDLGGIEFIIVEVNEDDQLACPSIVALELVGAVRWHRQRHRRPRHLRHR